MQLVAVSLSKPGDEFAERSVHASITSPHVSIATDAILIGRTVDGVVQVVMASATSRRDVVRMQALFAGGQIPVLGAVVNNFRMGNRAYGYYYRRYDGYHRQYGYGGKAY